MRDPWLELAAALAAMGILILALFWSPLTLAGVMRQLRSLLKVIADLTAEMKLVKLENKMLRGTIASLQEALRVAEKKAFRQQVLFFVLGVIASYLLELH